MSYSIHDLRIDLLNFKNLQKTSPLWIEIELCTKLAFRKLEPRLKISSFDSSDAFQIALEHLLKPMSAENSVTPLEHYLIHEFDQRTKIGQTFDLSEFRRILVTTIKNALVGQQKPGYVDNLVKRATKILNSPPYFRSGVKTQIRYYLSEREFDPNQIPRPAQIKRAANLCSMIPKILQTSESRLSPVYSAENLQRTVEIALREANGLTNEDLFNFFTILLTNWSPTVIYIPDDNSFAYTAGAPEDDYATSDTRLSALPEKVAHDIWTSLTENQRRLMHAMTFHENGQLTDQKIAGRVSFADPQRLTEGKNYSRSWVTDLRQKLMESLASILKQIEVDEQEDVSVSLLMIARGYEY